MSNNVLQRVFELSEVFAPSTNEWSFLSPSPDVRRYAGDPFSLITGLREEFADDVLEESGIVVRDRSEELCPSSVVSDSSPVFMCLRREKNGHPYDLVSVRGCLTTGQPPCFTACHDYFTKACCRGSQKLLVAFDMDGVAVLRMLRLPTTVAAGLESMDGQMLRQLFGHPERVKVFRSEHGQALDPLPEPDTRRKKVTIVLVGWGIADLNREEPKRLRAIITRLANVVSGFGFKTEDAMKVWRPTNDEASRIECAAHFRDLELVRVAISESLASSLYSLSGYYNATTPSAHKKESYWDLRRELIREIDRARRLKYESPELVKKLEKFNRVFDAAVIQPLLKDAMATGDSVERTLLLTAAELAERWHQTSPLVCSVKNGALRASDFAIVPLDPEELRQRLQIADRLVNIKRQLGKSK